MGNCIEIKSNKKIDSRPCIIPKRVGTDFDYGYSFLECEEMSPEKCIQVTPEENRIFFYIRGRVVCLDCLELYSWLKLNPKATLDGPFGSVTLSKFQKGIIYRKAEKLIPERDRLTQSSNFSWYNYQDSQTKKNFTSEAKKAYDNIVGSDYDFSCMRVTKYLHFLVSRDEGEYIRDLFCVINCDKELTKEFKLDLVTTCVRYMATDVFSQLVCQMDWLKGVDSEIVAEVVYLAVEVGKESFYRFVLSCLEDKSLLPKEQYLVDFIYAGLFDYESHWRSVEYTHRILGKYPSLSVIGELGEHVKDPEVFRWIASHAEGELQSEEQSELVDLCLEKFPDRLEYLFVK